MTLYELNNYFQTLLELAEDDTIDPATIQGSLEAVTGEWEVKLDSYATVIKELEADVDKLDKEMTRLKENKERILRNIDQMKYAVKVSMATKGVRRVNTEHFTWSIQKNGGKLPVIIDPSVSILSYPDEYQDWDVRPNRAAIREALEAGKELNFAKLGERGDSIRLK